MISVPLTLRFLVASGTAMVLVGCSSSGDETDHADSEAPTPAASASSAPSAPASEDAKQHYLDAVNALCDDLLPQVVDATHGGSTDIPAKEWVQTWPAHEALLDGFDADLTQVPVPPEAAEPAQVMATYVGWASGIDEARITAAQQGEAAWQTELTAEADLTSAPELLALAPAGFNDSCQAR